MWERERWVGIDLRTGTLFIDTKRVDNRMTRLSLLFFVKEYSNYRFQRRSNNTVIYIHFLFWQWFLALYLRTAMFVWRVFGQSVVFAPYIILTSRCCCLTTGIEQRNSFSLHFSYRFAVSITLYFLHWHTTVPKQNKIEERKRKNKRLLFFFHLRFYNKINEFIWQKHFLKLLKIHA